MLLDTNVYISLEPFAGLVEPGLGPAADLVRLCNRQGHQLFVHPATIDDLREGTDPARLQQRLAEIAKFELLAESPVPTSLIALAGRSPDGTNDHRDLRLLAALNARAVNYLISEDHALLRRAGRAKLGQSVLTIADATDLLQSLEPRAGVTPPRVEAIHTYALDLDQPIFGSLREDYDGFDRWLGQVQEDWENRVAFVITDAQSNAYVALALLKRVEADCEYDFAQPVSKLSTFKVDSNHAGSRFGELLLKSIFSASAHRRVATIYVEVYPHHDVLIDFLADFGFLASGHMTARGEIVLRKELRPADGSSPATGFDYHLLHGPPALDPRGQIHMIPVRPQWHEQLFPDAPVARRRPPTEQLSFPGLTSERTHPWGNAIRKAYLSNAASQRLSPGDTVLFYRSRDNQHVTAVGVVEATLRSADPQEIIASVGGRTVYSLEDITAMCRSGRPLLVLIFRQDRFIDPPWTLTELQTQGVTRTWPQSITTVTGPGATWVRSQLESP